MSSKIKMDTSPSNSTDEPQNHFSFVDAELNTIKFWNKNNIFKKSLEKNKHKKPYIFYDGPPFATGKPHHGHLVGSTLKDIVPRFFTMKGYYVDRRFGWDCHGLPIEQEIDKKLGISAQEAVEKLGVSGYNNECRSIVQRYTKEWQKTITRLGRWVDFENDYKTMDPFYMESIWWVFKELWNKDLIYQGVKVVPFSPQFGTVLSNFEASSNYKEVQDPSITVLFKIRKDCTIKSDHLKKSLAPFFAKATDFYLACWTTTPWTLPSNLGVCVHPELTYLAVKEEESGRHFFIAEQRLEAYKNKKRNFTVLFKVKGKDLESLRYEPLLPYFCNEEKNGSFTVFNDEYVTTEDGTGLVHTAPAFGEDDYRVFKKYKLKKVVCPIDDYGKFTSEVSDFTGQFVKDADKGIIHKLKDEGKLFSHETIVHNYPHCPRSDKVLLYRAIPSWFVKVEDIKEDLLKSNQEINWVPGHLKEGRFGKWLEGARDWAISRNRIWGTPLPIWINDKTKKAICVGSIEELKKYTGVEIKDLHRENVDPLTFSIEGEEGTYQRIPEVLDCWFESGSMPYAQIHYPFENKDVFKEGFPAEFIAEGLDQTRGWFYTLTVLSSALYKKPAFKNVIVNGLILAEDGKKMSKRLQNYTAPDSPMENYGADALRLYLINSSVVRGEEFRFSDHGVKDMVRRVLLPWYNSFKFFDTYASVDKWNKDQHFVQSDNILDLWILSRLNTLTSSVNHEMLQYKIYNVVPELFKFIDELTNWFIRLNRRRFWTEGLDQDKKMAYSTLYTTLEKLSVLMAPFAPFLSEYTFQNMSKYSREKTVESVHLMDFPEAEEKAISTELEDAVERMQSIVVMGRKKRTQVQIKVKTPLSELKVVHRDSKVLDRLKVLEEIIKNELNVKNLIYTNQEDDFIDLKAIPNSPILGKRFGKKFGQFRKAIQSLSVEEILKVERENRITLFEEDISAEEILVSRKPKDKSDALTDSLITIVLNTKLDHGLVLEGISREIINRIQKTRKALNFNVDDRISVQYITQDKGILSAIDAHRANIAKETLASEIVPGSTELENLSLFTYSIEDKEISFLLNKQN